MPDVKLKDVEMYISKDGDMTIKGISECSVGCYDKLLLINAENPVDESFITNTFIIFKLRDKKTRFSISYEDIIVNSEGFNLGSMKFTGEHLSKASATLFFLHDLVSEIRFYYQMKRERHQAVEFGVEYLRDRYLCIADKIKALDFERMIVCMEYK